MPEGSSDWDADEGLPEDGIIGDNLEDDEHGEGNEED
jgi:hypothetical protein